MHPEFIFKKNKIMLLELVVNKANLSSLSLLTTQLNRAARVHCWVACDPQYHSGDDVSVRHVDDSVSGASNYSCGSSSSSRSIRSRI